MNPHHLAAQEHLTKAADVPLIHKEIAATQALAEAQLSNAYEQHTANLINLRGITRDGALVTALNLVINERLGIEMSAETWHADDCGGTCDGCGHIAEDGFWYNAPCPDALLKYQIEWAENGVPNAVRTQ